MSLDGVSLGGIAVIGGGTMGETFVRSLTAAGLAAPADFRVCEIQPQRAHSLRSELGLAVTDSVEQAVEGARLVYLSVKPQDLGSLRRGLLGESQLLITILAGIPLRRIFDELSHSAVVRAMPNTPAQIGRGYTVWTAAPGVSDEQRELARAVLGAMGEELYVADEAAIDRATAVSGSGPAYVFMILEALTDAAVQIGISRQDARRMVLETVIGSAEYAAASSAHLAELRDQVTSPAGTTAAGVRALEDRGLRAALIDAVAAAHTRAQELADA